MFLQDELLQLRISADFTKVNTAPTDDESRTGAVVTFEDGQWARVTPDIVARGNLRFRWCGTRPFSLKFQEGQTEGTPFKGLGKSVKFVTHCGDKEGMPPDLKAPSLEEYEQRVLMEHTVYQVLDTLGVPSLKSRLARLTYHDTHTNEEETHYAFVLEPEDTMAKRCGLIEQEDADPLQPMSENPRSVLSNHLLNAFVLQFDWSLGTKNSITLVDPVRQELFFAPYDFDMVAVSRPDYSKNRGRTLAENGALFGDFLKHNQSPALFERIEHLLSRAEAMQAAILNSKMDDAHRLRFTDWLAHYLPILRTARSCEGHTDDPERQDCYLADDHGDSAETATLFSIGERRIRLLPPTDVDVFFAALEAGVFYTLGGHAELELLDASGNLLAKATEVQPVSRRWATTEPVYLRASLGDGLVAARLDPEFAELNRNVFLYVDDHGSSADTATRISAGQTVDGRWELVDDFDQDWLLLDTAVSPGFHVRVEDSVIGTIELTRLDAPDHATGAFLDPGDNDLSFLFEEIGAPDGTSSIRYLIKLSGPAGSYVASVR